MSPEAFAVLLGLVGLQRLFELAVSRRNLRAARERHGGELPAGATGRAAWCAMIAVHTALVVAPALEVSLARRTVPVPVVVAAAVVLAAAQVLRAWTLHTLGPAWNARAVVDPAVAIVAHGPYRFVRHPNYLAVVLEFLALPALGGAWISLLLLNALHAAVLAHRIRGEERLLSAIPAWRERIAPKGALLPRWRDLRSFPRASAA